MKLYIGNRTYSSWSLRGWLAAKQSGLPFAVEVVPLFASDGTDHRAHPALAPGGGRVPVLHDGDAVVWDSLAIMEYLADKVGHSRFWPEGDAARGWARAMVAEMHAGFAALRAQCPMNLRLHLTEHAPGPATQADIARIAHLWAGARARFGQGGPFLFGGFGAADIAFAPVVCRFAGYGIALPSAAEAYVQAVRGHAWLQDWVAKATQEEWVIAQYEPGAKP